jgi:hypothetical protein
MKLILEPAPAKKEAPSALADAIADIELVFGFEATSRKEGLPEMEKRIGKQVDIILKDIGSADLAEKNNICEVFIDLVEKNLSPELQQKIAQVFSKIDNEASSALIREISQLRKENNFAEQKRMDNENQNLFFLVKFFEVIIEKVSRQNTEKLVTELKELLAESNLDITLLIDATKSLAAVGDVSVKILLSELNELTKNKAAFKNYLFSLNEAILNKRVSLEDKLRFSDIYISLLKQGSRLEISKNSDKLAQGLINVGAPAFEKLLAEINEQNLAGIDFFVEPLAELAGQADADLLNKALLRLNELLLKADSKYMQLQIQEAIDKIQAKVPKAA